MNCLNEFCYENEENIDFDKMRSKVNQSLEILFLEDEGEFSAENLKKDINLLQN